MLGYAVAARATRPKVDDLRPQGTAATRDRAVTGAGGGTAVRLPMIGAKNKEPETKAAHCSCEAQAKISLTPAYGSNR